jgi:hypothetical protein
MMTISARRKKKLAPRKNENVLEPPNRFSCTTLVALTTLLLDRNFSSGLESASRKFFKKDFHKPKFFVLA